MFMFLIEIDCRQSMSRRYSVFRRSESSDDNVVCTVERVAEVSRGCRGSFEEEEEEKKKNVLTYFETLATIRHSTGCKFSESLILHEYQNENLMSCNQCPL